MNDQESTDPVWELLKHAKKVEPSAFFVHNVMRKARQDSSQPATFLSRIRHFPARRIIFAGMVACALLALSFIFILDRSHPADADAVIVSIHEEPSDAFDPASEMAAVEYLGQLMAVADPGQLDDAALADLFF